MGEVNEKLKQAYIDARANLAAAAERVDITKGVSQNNAKMDFIAAQLNMISIQLTLYHEEIKSLKEEKKCNCKCGHRSEKVCIHCGKPLSGEVSPDGIRCETCGLIYGWTDADKVDPKEVWEGYKEAVDKGQFPIYWPHWDRGKKNE